LAYTVIIHVVNAEPIVGEVDEMPSPKDNFILLNNPRTLDGKDLNFIHENVATVLWPFDRLNFIEFLTSKEDEEEIIGFVRE